MIPENLILHSAGLEIESAKMRLHHRVFDRVFLRPVQDKDVSGSSGSPFKYFELDDTMSYVGFADDFGPMNMASIFSFCELLDSQLEKFVTDDLALVARSDPQPLTNAIFLLGAYLIMRQGYDLAQTVACFSSIMHLTVPYRDVSPGEQNFELHVQDCWAGLVRGKQLGWANFSPDGFDLAEYQHYDNTLNADLHEIVPGKFVAMRGPRDLGHGAAWEDMAGCQGSTSHRDFSPQHYADILPQFSARCIVRLNAPQYSRHALARYGIAVADLFFEDCTAPPVDVVAKFLALAETLPGALAVHCKSGLGRTGTLIALYMMKHHGFSAREAMGWLRIVRPGSVIGEQQDFLCAREALMRRSAAPVLPPADVGGDEGEEAEGGWDAAGAARTERRIDDVVARVDARMAAAARHPAVLAAAALGAPALRRTGSLRTDCSSDAAAPPPEVAGALSLCGGLAAAAAAGPASRLAAHVSAAADHRSGRLAAAAVVRGGSFSATPGH